MEIDVDTSTPIAAPCIALVTKNKIASRLTRLTPPIKFHTTNQSNDPLIIHRGRVRSANEPEMMTANPLAKV